MKLITALSVSLFLATFISSAQTGIQGGGEPRVMTLDLSKALSLADERNTDLAISLEEVRQASLLHQEAWYEWLPTLRAGLGYSHQEGVLQDTDGTVRGVERYAESKGIGIANTGSGLPPVPGASLELDLAEAVYAPKIAKENLRAARANQEEVRFLRMMEVVSAYYGLVLANSAVALNEQALAEAASLEESTNRFAQVGQGLQSDADRVSVEKLIREFELENARLQQAEAANTLARLLNLNESVTVRSDEMTLVPLSVYSSPPDDLQTIRLVLENRSLMDELEARMKAKRAELRSEQQGPFIPHLGAYYSDGRFEGGTGSSGGEFRDREDVSVAIYWELNGLGLTDISKARRRKSEARQMEAQYEQAKADIIAEIRTILSDFKATSSQLDILQRGIERARSSYELSRERIFENQGLPIEALDSFKSLAEIEMLYAQTVARHNLTQLYIKGATGQDLR